MTDIASTIATHARSRARFSVVTLTGVGLLLVMLWGGLGAHLAFDRAQTIARAAQNVANLSQVVDEHVIRRVYEIDQTLIAAQRDYARDPGRFVAGSAVVPGLGISGLAARIRIVDADGRTVLGAAAGRPPLINPGDRAALAAQRAAAGNRLLIGRPVALASGKMRRWSIPFSRRLVRADHSFAGVVVITVDPAFLSAAFDKLKFGRAGFVAVVRRAGFVNLACATAAGVTVLCPTLRNTLLRSAVARASAGAFLDTGAADGAARIIGYRMLPDYPLLIAIGVSKEEVLGPYIRRRDRLCLAAALLSVVILCAGGLLIRQDARQKRTEQALSRQAGKLSESRLEAERARAAAQTANQAKSEFLADMSHELRTPLNAILGFAEAMSSEVFGPLSSRYREYAQDIHKAGSHLLNITNQILDLSKIEAGRLELKEEEIVVAELFDGCRRIVAERAAAGGVSLAFGATDHVVRADPLRLRQMLLNLLSNAIKFTPPDGQISVTAESTDGDGVAISVRDTGIGIKPEEFAKILEPFGQVYHPEMRSAEGTGLGLPLVRRLIELHGGRMAFDSSPGRGTAVALIFPPTRNACRRLEKPALATSPDDRR